LILANGGDGSNCNRIAGQETRVPVKWHENYTQNHEGNKEDKSYQPVFEKVFDKAIKHTCKVLIGKVTASFKKQ